MDYSFEFKGKTFSGKALGTKKFMNKIEVAWKIENINGHDFYLEFFQEKNGIEIGMMEGEVYKRVLDRYPPTFQKAVEELPKILENMESNTVS